MTLVELVVALFMFGTGCSVFGWVWTSALGELQQGQATAAVTECLNTGAEWELIGKQVPAAGLVVEPSCRLTSTTTVASGVEWVRLSAEVDGAKEELWVRH